MTSLALSIKIAIFAIIAISVAVYIRTLPFGLNRVPDNVPMVFDEKEEHLVIAKVIKEIAKTPEGMGLLPKGIMDMKFSVYKSVDGVVYAATSPTTAKLGTKTIVKTMPTKL
jgi:hypothetical protein